MTATLPPEIVRDTAEPCPECRQRPGHAEVWALDQWRVVMCRTCYLRWRERAADHSVTEALTGSKYQSTRLPIPWTTFEREWQALEDRFNRRHKGDAKERYHAYLTGRLDTREFQRACRQAFAAAARFPSPAELVAYGRQQP